MNSFFTRHVRDVAASFIVAVGLIIAIANTATGCSLFTAQNAKTALSVLDISCILVHAELPDTEVANVCGIADPFLKDLQALLAQQRAQLAKAKAHERMMSCGPDGGPDAGK